MNSSNSQAFELVLASSSPYRRALLERLGLSFNASSPNVDETRHNDEPVTATTLRLAQSKAAALRTLYPSACIIGSDQLCATEDERGHVLVLGKPGSRDAAIEQLQALSDREVQFHTAVCVSHADQIHTASDVTRVRFRALTLAEIQRYLDAEPDAIHCAGSFMSEALGISLCEAIISDDPSALIGLPLIATARLLRQAGFPLP